MFILLCLSITFEIFFFNISQLFFTFPCARICHSWSNSFSLSPHPKCKHSRIRKHSRTRTNKFCFYLFLFHFTKRKPKKKNRKRRREPNCEEQKNASPSKKNRYFFLTFIVRNVFTVSILNRRKTFNWIRICHMQTINWKSKNYF